MVKIKSLRLENCQSWEDETIHFAPGLNAIIANNNVGKSVVFKILKVTCNPDFFAKPERAKLVRYGKEYAKATYSFSDESVAVVTITDKKVMYDFTDASGATAHSEDQPLSQILQRLSVIVEDNSKYLVNVLDSEQSLLLVKSDKKANSDLLKVITEHKGIDRLIALFKDKALKYNGVASEVKTRGDKIRFKLDSLQLKDVDTLKDQVNRLDVLYSELNFLEDLDIEANRLNEAINELSPIDWGCFIEFLSNVNYIDYLEPVGWGELLDLLEHLPKQRLSVPNLDVDWEAVAGLLQQRQDVNLEPKPDLSEFKILVKMYDECHVLENLLNQSKQAQNKIAELKSIDFNGTVYDCPVHGKIVYNNGKCEVSNGR